MERPKWVAIATGILAIALGVGYLLLVQLLDYRGGEFLPAPLDPLAFLGQGFELSGGKILQTSSQVSSATQAFSVRD
ncbi:MAG: hypothetical protein SNJ68_10225 [Cyanobacteriota bacterium]